MERKYSPRVLCFTALLLAVNVVLSSFGIPVPGGRMYLNDAVICLAGILLDPFCAFVVGGVGSFLGDLLFYPTPMFVSLVVHGLQAVVISRITKKASEECLVRMSVLGTAVGAVIMIVGYTLGRAYIYSTPAYALMKLPFQILQAVVGGIVGLMICWDLDFYSRYQNFLERDH